MLFTLLAEEAANNTAGGNKNMQWIMIAIVGALFVAMIVYTVFSSRKRKKQQDTMPRRWHKDYDNRQNGWQDHASEL